MSFCVSFRWKTLVLLLIVSEGEALHMPSPLVWRLMNCLSGADGKILERPVCI